MNSKPGAVSIRLAAQSDFAAVTALRDGLMRQSHLERPDLFRTRSLDTVTEALFAIWISAADSQRLVATIDGAVGGYASVWYGQSAPGDWMFQSRIAFIMELFVRPSARQQGLGRALFEAIQTEADRRDCESISLNMNAANALGRAFYDRMGYRSESEIRTKMLKRIVRVERP